MTMHYLCLCVLFRAHPTMVYLYIILIYNSSTSTCRRPSVHSNRDEVRPPPHDGVQNFPGIFTLVEMAVCVVTIRSPQTLQRIYNEIIGGQSALLDDDDDVISHVSSDDGGEWDGASDLARRRLEP